MQAEFAVHIGADLTVVRAASMPGLAPIVLRFHLRIDPVVDRPATAATTPLDLTTDAAAIAPQSAADLGSAQTISETMEYHPAFFRAKIGYRTSRGSGWLMVSTTSSYPFASWCPTLACRVVLGC